MTTSNMSQLLLQGVKLEHCQQPHRIQSVEVAVDFINSKGTHSHGKIVSSQMMHVVNDYLVEDLVLQKGGFTGSC